MKEFSGLFCLSFAIYDSDTVPGKFLTPGYENLCDCVLKAAGACMAKLLRTQHSGRFDAAKDSTKMASESDHH
jgi:hypothetical protein